MIWFNSYYLCWICVDSIVGSETRPSGRVLEALLLHFSRLGRYGKIFMSFWYDINIYNSDSIYFFGEFGKSIYNSDSMNFHLFCSTSSGFLGPKLHQGPHSRSISPSPGGVGSPWRFWLLDEMFPAGFVEKTEFQREKTTVKAAFAWSVLVSFLSKLLSEFL